VSSLKFEGSTPVFESLLKFCLRRRADRPGEIGLHFELTAVSKAVKVKMMGSGEAAISFDRP